MSTLSTCFCGEIRKRCTSYEYPQHVFLWRNKKKDALLVSTLSIYFCGEIRKRCTSNEYPQHMFFGEI